MLKKLIIKFINVKNLKFINSKIIKIYFLKVWWNSNILLQNDYLYEKEPNKIYNKEEKKNLKKIEITL